MIIEAKNLVKKYKRGKKEFYAVDHVNFSLQEGSFTVIMGESGCGKSTLFHLLTGMCSPDEGTVRFQEEEITHISGKEMQSFEVQILATYCRDRIFFIILILEKTFVCLDI